MTASGWSGTPYQILVNPADGSRLAAASSSGLYTSANGGATWTRVTTAFGSAVSCVLSSDGLSVIIGTSSQGIWKWENWTGTPVQISSTPAATTTLYDSPNYYLYAGTPAGSVWRSYYGTGTGGSTSGLLPGSSFSVYPNPVSGGIASASFNLPSPGSAGISVYDITGRLVIALPSAELSEGSHTVGFSTENLAPGVYFARLSHQGTSVTTTMVVTR